MSRDLVRQSLDVNVERHIPNENRRGLEEYCAKLTKRRAKRGVEENSWESESNGERESCQSVESHQERTSDWSRRGYRERQGYLIPVLLTAQSVSIRGRYESFSVGVLRPLMM